jgi:hypothetical protein
VSVGAVAAGLETGAFALFQYGFVQDFYRLSSLTATAQLVFLVPRRHIGIIRIHAYSPEDFRIDRTGARISVAPSRSR